MKFSLRQGALLTLCSLTLFAAAYATSVIIPSDNEMIIGARAIVYGKVTSVAARYDDQRHLAFTYITVDVKESIKGPFNSGEITLKEPGGVTPSGGTILFGTPQFTVGEETLLYLDTWADGDLRVYQWFLGKFNVTPNRAIGKLVATRASEGPQLTVLGRSPGTITDRLDLRAYIDLVRGRVAATQTESAQHEAKYFKQIAPRARPLEINQWERLPDSFEQNFTFINPGAPPRWFEPDAGQPVIFKINPQGAPNAQTITDLTAVMNAWSTVSGSALRVVSGGTTSTCGLLVSDGENTISFNNCDNYSPFSPPAGQTCSGILAAAGIVRYNPYESKVIGGMTFYRAVEGNLSFNPYASCYFSNSCNVQEIATHELGHALGLGHTVDSTATMYAYAHFDGRCASLKADDINGIKFMYPATTAAPLIIATSTFNPSQTGVAFAQTLVGAGGSTPYTWSLVSGALPPGLVLSAEGGISGTPTVSGTFYFTVNLTDGAGRTAQQALAMAVAAGATTTVRPTPTPTVSIPTTTTSNPATIGNGLQYYPLPYPVRLLDTRPGYSACVTPGAAIAGNSSYAVNARTFCNGAEIPGVAQALVGNATVVSQGYTSGFVTIYPSGAARPNTSNLNFAAGETIANAFTATLGANGSLNLYTSDYAHLIIDITGYYAPPGQGGLYYHPLPGPFRLLDTRRGYSACDTPGVPLAAGNARTEQVWVSCAGGTVPASAQVVTGNATVVALAGHSGHVTLYPNGMQTPNVSNVNFTSQQVIPNAFTIKLGASGALSLFASDSTDLLIDISGYFSADAYDSNGQGLLYYPISYPIRLLDTRPGFAACNALAAPLAGGQSRTQFVRQSCYGVVIPAGAQAVTGNATVVNQTSAGGHVIIYPTGAAVPNVSNLNFTGGMVIPNLFTVRLGSGGSFDIFPTSSVHFIIDLAGFFAP